MSAMAMTVAPAVHGSTRTAVRLEAARLEAVRQVRVLPARVGPARVGPARVRHTEPGTPPAPLRLTVRGRAVVWLLGCALAAGVGGAAASAQADGPIGATEVRRVVVAPGDTLWQIAAGVAAPHEDVRDVVLQLIALNELPSGGLQAGQTIVVPVG